MKRALKSAHDRLDAHSEQVQTGTRKAIRKGEIMADLDKLVEELSALTILEAADLKKKLEDAWGVEAAAGGMMMMAPGAGAAVAEARRSAASPRSA